MSDWRDNLGVKIPLLATSRGPNAIALADTARPVLILGASTCVPMRLLLVDQSSPGLLHRTSKKLYS